METMDSSTQVEISQEWLDSESTALVALAQEIKSQKKRASKSETAFQSLNNEVQTLETKWKKANDKLKQRQNDIRLTRRCIRRRKILLDKVKGRKDEIRKQIEIAEKDFQDAKAKSEEVQLLMKDFQSRFDDIGMDISHEVTRRAELYKELDTQKANLSKLEIEDEDPDVDDLCKKDPLFLIENNYPFFPNEHKCSLEDIGNIENPKRCMEAMNSFVNVLYENVHRFKHLPMGPLYHNIIVKNKKWAPIVEYILRPYLFTFLVDNIVDGLVMDELLEQHFPGYKPGMTNTEGVIVPNYRVFAFKNKHLIDSRITAMSGMELENMLETIHYTDDNWGNFLSHAISIEKIILMDNENIAFLVLSHIKNTPWHCKRAYTLDGFVVYPFPDFRTKQIKLYDQCMYLKSLPSFKVGETRSKIWRTRRHIDIINLLISGKRGCQLRLAKEIDDMRFKVEVAHSYQLVCLAMKKEIVGLLNEPGASCSTEKRQLKYLKNQVKKFRKETEQLETQLNKKVKVLLEQKQGFEKDKLILSQLEEKLVQREKVFFETREKFWQLEDEMESEGETTESCHSYGDDDADCEFSCDCDDPDCEMEL